MHVQQIHTLTRKQLIVLETSCDMVPQKSGIQDLNYPRKHALPTTENNGSARKTKELIKNVREQKQ